VAADGASGAAPASQLSAEASGAAAATAVVTFEVAASAVAAAVPASVPQAAPSAADAPVPQTPAVAQPDAGSDAPIVAEIKPGRHATLLQQRLAATKEAFARGGKSSASIQLYYTSNPQPSRVEGFLARAKGLGKLSEIYVLPARINGSNGYRVLYGFYADAETAREGMQQLPERYQKAFAPSLYFPESGQALSN
jgi:septal ring-binding cell division protein DamX